MLNIMTCVACNGTARYGTEFKKPIHCVKHRIQGEVNCVTKRCERCDKIATVGWLHSSLTRCHSHKEPDMVYTVVPKCHIRGCQNLAHFGPGLGLTCRCVDHIQDGDMNVIFSQCRSCFIIITHRNLQNGICKLCTEKKAHGCVDDESSSDDLPTLADDESSDDLPTLVDLQSSDDLPTLADLQSSDDLFTSLKRSGCDTIDQDSRLIKRRCIIKNSTVYDSPIDLLDEQTEFLIF